MKSCADTDVVLVHSGQWFREAELFGLGSRANPVLCGAHLRAHPLVL
jgi:hypothetical protein